MTKLFDYPYENIKRIPTEKWFELNQHMLLWIANTKEGRDLLCIPQIYPKIKKFYQCSIHWQNENKTFGADFRVGAKWANIVRYRWKDFSKLQEAYWKYNDIYNVIQFPLKPALLVATTGTFYPDSGNPGTTTVDGRVTNQTTNQSWATKRAAAGDAVNNSTTSDFLGCVEGSVSANQFDYLHRNRFGFDTSSITSANVVSAATLSLYGSTKQNDASYSDSNLAVSLVSGSFGSNTTLANADYNVANFGSTKYATDLVYSSYSTVGYNDMALNSTGYGAISVTGVTNIGARTAFDVGNVDPSDGTATGKQQFFSHFFADNTGTSKDPKLVVTYAAIPAAGGTGMLMGV